MRYMGLLKGNRESAGDSGHRYMIEDEHMRAERTY